MADTIGDNLLIRRIRELEGELNSAARVSRVIVQSSHLGTPYDRDLEILHVVRTPNGLLIKTAEIGRG